MRFGLSFFRSKLSRRFLALFLTCAFLPTIVLLALSYHRVRDQLYDQEWNRLDRESKVFSLALLDRLLHMNNLLHLYGASLALEESGPSTHLKGQLQEMFISIGLYSASQAPVPLLGTLNPHFDEVQFDWATEWDRRSHLYVSPAVSGHRQVSLVLPLDEDGKRYLVARPKSTVLWGVGAFSMLPPMTELAVYDGGGRAIMATAEAPGTELTTVSPLHRGNFIRFTYSGGDGEYLASGWSLFLSSNFVSEPWTIILSESRSAVLGPMEQFKRMYSLITLLVIWVVLLLSFSFIRRTLAPLAALQRGTEQIGRGEFARQVTIRSDDEFEQLAESFNTMANRLDKQFHAQSLVNDINQAILSSLDRQVIIPKSLHLISDFFNNRRVLVALRDQTDRDRLHLSILDQGSRTDLRQSYARLDEEQRRRLFTGNPVHILGPETYLPTFLDQALGQGNYLFLPLASNYRANGALVVEVSGPIGPTEEEVGQARQFADQLAIALANASLVADLERLSIGTVEALARTVDAKSRWTAGHSERVAELAVRIGRILGLTNPKLDLLYRGGLLHDIGKIGIPMAILEKPDRLDEEEYRTVQSHPRIGAKILEPIEVYRDILPLVEQHHERYDGQGYPQGLIGKDIALGARILAVADVYDALISQRPYRQGWVREKVLRFMQNNRQTMFDPQVIDAFLTLEL